LTVLDSGQDRVYTLYGVPFRSRYPFSNHLIATSDAPQFVFEVSERAPAVDPWQDRPPVWESESSLSDGRPVLRFLHGDGFLALRYTDVCDFYLWPDRIYGHLTGPAYAYAVEIYFLGAVMCVWLEHRGIRVLHASAVVAGDEAVGFIAGKHSGKSSLAAAFLERGFLLLTDDFLAIDCARESLVAYPGYPQMRMWPDQIRHFLGSEDGLPLVHPEYDKRRVPVEDGTGLGSFHPEPTPLGALYLPERRDPALVPEPRVVPLSPRDAVIDLIGRSFLGRLAGSPTLEVDRFRSLVALAGRIPVRRLVFPEGTHHLPGVVDAVLADRGITPQRG
jgi:hypothetical protein